MKERLILLPGVALLLASACALCAEAPVINVDFGYQWRPTYSGPGAAGVGGLTWNAVQDEFPVDLKDSQGEPTPVSLVSVSPGRIFWQKDPEWTMKVIGAEELMLDYWFTGMKGKPEPFEVELSGIPTDWTFDLYVYAAGDTNNQGTQIRVGDSTQATVGLTEPGEVLAEGKHYVVFRGVTAPDGSLVIEAVHNPKLPGPFGALNGFQIVVAEKPPPIVTEEPEAEQAMSSGLWVTIGFGLAIIMVVVVRLATRSQPNTSVRRQLRDKHDGEALLDAPGANAEQSLETDDLRRLAADAERRAHAAESVVREGLMPEMKKVLKDEVVSSLVAERDELLEAQRQAAMDIDAIERRLTEMQAPVQDRLETYERRISDLEQELNQRGAENRELLKATIALARQKVEEVRSRNRIDFN